MDKTLQDLAWSCLPKEFKEEVKNHYRQLMLVLDRFQSKTSLNNEECDRCDLVREKITVYNKLYGHHNLTSDAEGEEMLCMSKKRVQEMYKNNCDEIRRENISSSDKDCYEYANEVLKTLFGSKCLPDEACNVASNVASTEPKYHKGEKVFYNGYVYEIEGLVGKNRYALKGLNFDLDEDMIESYTEPEENVNLSQETANCDKQFDNILKDGFAKERRLNIAAQMMQGLICAPLIPGVDPNPSAEYLAQAAFRLADALLAEWCKD